jgi:signal transduction histidine kinase/CheY-like chemotaxis protein
MGDGNSVTNFESEVVCKNGATIWISENVRVVRDQHGNTLYLEGFVSDITKHRRLDEEMQRASKLEAVGILAGGIAHDFNNILTAVLGNIGLAEMELKKGGLSSELLGEAKRASLRARDLTQQLLTFAKGGEPVRASVNLPELLRETTDFALHGAKARAEFHLAEDLWPVNADKGQLGRVVQNLVINSVQAMPEGGTVKVSADNKVFDDPAGSVTLPPGRYVHLAVADSGTGISADNLTKIFDPYFTTKKQGSGLGLATVYSIVKKHQGFIEVESQLGRGTTFHLWLPAATQAAPVKIAEMAAGVPLQARVLFMDDEQPIRDMARAFMRRLNVECELAVDGAEAVRKYQEARAANRPFDVVVMDLTVPGGIGGREAMGMLQKIDPAVRAIVSSGYSQDPVMASHRSHGFQSVLPKPYDLGQLRHALENALSASPS